MPFGCSIFTASGIVVFEGPVYTKAGFSFFISWY